jgi:NAD(P)-dependent dehydrogenase (short-subunit alcohol dehydrogenase family)
MQKPGKKEKERPAQSQRKQPGAEWKLDPQPIAYYPHSAVYPKLTDKVALITGGDSGIGRAVAINFALQGAEVAIIFTADEQKDADETAATIMELTDKKCLLISTDISSEKNCMAAVKQVVKRFGRVDILVNNAGIHYPQESILDITDDQLQKTFATNVYAMFYLVKACMPHMTEGCSIINTASVTAYRGSGHLIDYAATKGAIVSFTRSLSASLKDKGIRVNGVAPGPIWTPLIAASFKAKDVATFGSEAPMGRAGEPVEVASCFVFLASDDASYITGQFLHPNGGEIING